MSGRVCVVCQRAELGDDEAQTCIRCLSRTRSALIEVEQLYALLPQAIADHAGAASPPDAERRSGGDGLPGGDAMVLLGPGSARWHSETVDVDSVLGYLERSERDWRITLGMPAATTPATVSGCVTFLTRWLGTVAQQHPAFDEFARDLSHLRESLLRATREGLLTERGVACLECGTRLVRGYDKPQPCLHDGGHTDACDQGGRGQWRCPNNECRRTVYDDDEYTLAMWQHLHEHRRNGGTDLESGRASIHGQDGAGDGRIFRRSLFDLDSEAVWVDEDAG